ncbi:N-6 DNA methylase [Agrobacterium sp. Ap1]|uniref:N-6 DNA methylase n=1 Tax=Agrobacterium sp. Ap1 TaxID=2815337 RepID=UPI00336C1D58
MTYVTHRDPIDTSVLRKERGAFFTPPAITRFISRWAIRAPEDRVLEPAAGDAAFLVSAVERLRELAPRGRSCPMVHGVEIHTHSADVARKRVADAGGEADIQLWL